MISKSPQGNHSFISKLFYTKNARTAWRHLLDSLEIKAPNKILLPAYIGRTDREGSGIFDPVLESNTPFSFYKLNNNLSFNAETIEEKLQEGNIRLLLVVHYFGFCTCDIERIQSLCKKHNVILVEDCAHAFQLHTSSSEFGSYGDYSFYSLHKYFDISSGGILRINTEKFAVPSLKETDKCDVLNLEKIVASNTVGIADRRRTNYIALYNKIKALGGITVMHELSEFIIPHNLPIIVENSLREKLYFRLIEKDVPTIALYYRMIDELPKERYENAHFVSNNILNLPIHQDITTDDIEYISNSIAAALKELSK